MFVTAALFIRLGLWGLTATAPSSLDGACRVELVPDDAPRVWAAAVSALRESLRRGRPADRDCRDVVVYASTEHPSVEVTTVDGRRGVRRLADARDIEPTVAALIVTVLAESITEDVAAGLTAVERPAKTTPVAPETAGWRALIVASGGARLSLPGTSAPLLELGLGGARRGWELSLLGAWAPKTISTGATTPPGFSSSAEVALGGARRQAIGETGVDLILGARLGVIRLEGDSAVDSTGTGDNVDANLAGVGPVATAVLGAAFPTRAMVRFRSQLWFQWAAATRFGSPNATSRLASLGLSIGAESRLP